MTNMHGFRAVSLIVLLILAVAPAGLSAQGKEIQGQEINDEQVMQAAGAIFSLYLYGAMGIQYGQAPEGVSYNEEAKQFHFDEVDLSGLSDAYTDATGTIIREAENTLRFNFTLTGGPVSTIQYRIARDPEDPQGKSKPMDIKVNGGPYTLTK